nr:MAG TPA: C2H2 type zinc-finger protein [Caudoviricetes sp.]
MILSKRPPKSTKTCAVCGKTFPCFPSDKTVTCGKECSRIHRSRIHTGLSNKWSEESRTRKAAQGKTANLALGTPAAQKSPKSGKFLTNVNAKDWHLISPDGKEYKFHSLNYWLRENGDKLFGCVPDSKEFKNVSTGLSGAKRAMLGRNYGCCTYKGWKVIPTEHDIK